MKHVIKHRHPSPRFLEGRWRQDTFLKTGLLPGQCYANHDGSAVKVVPYRMRTGAFNHKGFVFVNDYRFVLILHSGLSRGHDKQVIMRMTVHSFGASAVKDNNGNRCSLKFINYSEDIFKDDIKENNQ